ncbi:hypothetical protein N7456_010250 [Penicillium angulare]|uniref:Aminoglycoside phosphotransferase domain-containing protein n=1 Tax=Penicillium angulare TaxID=116970 RepID=A0A9W9F6B2_9EURO|nr:hypothetical protein N7456_010250 [Penicillium angulare]
MATSSFALGLVSSADLSPQEHIILKYFIERAVDPEFAANYLISRINADPSAGVEICLRSFKEDWRRLVTKLGVIDDPTDKLDSLVRQRDGPYCFMSQERPLNGSSAPLPGPIQSAYILPPSMIRDIISNESSLFEVMEAFVSPAGFTEIKSLVSGSDDTDSAIQNVWCLTPGIYQAIVQGDLSVQTIHEFTSAIGYCSQDEVQEDMYIISALSALFPPCSFANGWKFDGSFTFSVPISDSALNKPSHFIINVHHRLAVARADFVMEDQITRGLPECERSTKRHAYSPGCGETNEFLGFIPPLIRRTFYCLSRCIPLWVRMKIYMFLKPIGLKRLGATNVPWVHRLPFGLIMKQCIRAPESEPNALRLVEKYTTIPAPRLVDVGEYNGDTYLIMTCLPGRQLNQVFDYLTYPERQRLAEDLTDCVSQMRKIPNNTPYRFANTLGGPICDHRLGKAGPFNTEADFNSHRTTDPKRTLDGLIMRQDHQSYFTHADIHPYNIMIEGGRFSGLVDWECAGFMPEYWEYVKAKRAAHWRPVMEDIVERTFGHVYDDEWEIETKFWRYEGF